MPSLLTILSSTNQLQSVVCDGSVLPRCVSRSKVTCVRARRKSGGWRGELAAQSSNCSSSLSVRDNNEPFICPRDGPLLIPTLHSDLQSAPPAHHPHPPLFTPDPSMNAYSHTASHWAYISSTAASLAAFLPQCHHLASTVG